MLKFKFTIIALYLYISFLFSGLLFLGPISILNLFISDSIGFIIKNIYITSITFIMKYIFNIEVFINSNKLAYEIVNNDQQIILIQNHFSEIDFLYISYFLSNLNKIKFKIIYIAKKSIGLFLLGGGLFSAFSKDIYLNRKISDDTQILINENDADILYMFPEGTCLNKKTKEKSDLYVKENKLINFKYLLYPRTTGLNTILNTHKNYKKIYDLTVLYDTIDKNDLLLTHKFINFFYKYDFPTKIYININKFNITQNLDLQNYMEEIFLQKDDFIKNFNLLQNKFKKIKLNFLTIFSSFLFSSFFTFLSIYLFYSYKFIQSLYITQTICYIFYFLFLYY